jgi:hypothetical protein
MLQARKVRVFGFISKLVLTTFSSRELSREILRNVFLFVILVERVEEYVVSWLTISRSRNILQHISIFLAYEYKARLHGLHIPLFLSERTTCDMLQEIRTRY